MGYGSIGSPLFSVVNARPSGDIALDRRREAQGHFSGDVSASEPRPRREARVRGDIRLGSSGEYFAPAGPENLRILRGKISSTGAILFGSGFTASRSSTGVYGISLQPRLLPGECPILTASGRTGAAPRGSPWSTSPRNIAVAIRIVNRVWHRKADSDLLHRSGTGG